MTSIDSVASCTDEAAERQVQDIDGTGLVVGFLERHCPTAEEEVLNGTPRNSAVDEVENHSRELIQRLRVVPADDVKVLVREATHPTRGGPILV